jgi:hypothetical protein
MQALPNKNSGQFTIKNVEQLNFYVLFNNKLLILVCKMYNSISCKTNGIDFCYIWQWTTMMFEIKIFKIFKSKKCFSIGPMIFFFNFSLVRGVGHEKKNVFPKIPDIAKYFIIPIGISYYFQVFPDISCFWQSISLYFLVFHSISCLTFHTSYLVKRVK